MMVLKPIISALKLNFPGGMLMIVKRPFKSDAVPKAVPSKYIFAPGRGSPVFLSLTSPEIFPVV